VPLSFSPSLQRERELQAEGFARVAGVDEAGRGPLAGPVVAAAVILSADFSASDWPQLNDSKQVSPSVRAQLFERIQTTQQWGIGVVGAQEIDEINIRQASWRAMQIAVYDLQARAKGVLPSIDYVLLDGLEYGAAPWPYEGIIKGDSKSFSIAAASIIAKETRDNLMSEYDLKFPGYGFARHKGYGTAAHLKALKELGPCAIHRRTFAPVRAAMEDHAR